MLGFDVASSVCGGIMMVFCIFGIVGNLTSMFVFSRPHLRSSINVLLTGLSGIDLLVVILAIPSFALTGLNTYLQSASINRLHEFNTMYIYPVACMAQTSSIWTFVIISIERFVAVCYPFIARNLATIGRARLALITVIMSAIAYNIVRFYEHRYESTAMSTTCCPENDDENNRSSNLADTTNAAEAAAEDYSTGPAAVVREFLRADPTYYQVYYSALFLVTHFLVPFSVLAIVNSCAAYTISKAKRCRRSLTTQQQSEHRTTTMMLIVVLMFLVCNTLPFVLNLVEAVNQDLFKDEHQPAAQIGFLIIDISNTLVVINSASTCVVYYLFSQRYRSVVRLVLAGQLASVSDKRRRRATNYRHITCSSVSDCGLAANDSKKSKCSSSSLSPVPPPLPQPGISSERESTTGSVCCTTNFT